MTPALLHALHHPVRRQVLRALHEEGAALSPSELSRKSISIGLPCLSFHARVLCVLKVTECASTRQVRGSTEHFYASTVARNELVAAILRETEADDALLQRARR
jgi:DNA-binding transcriptional ArsR family regulator